MRFVIIARNAIPSDIRRQDYAQLQVELEDVAIIYGGPLIENDQEVGYVFVIDMSSRAAADRVIASSSYFTRFECVEFYESEE